MLLVFNNYTGLSKINSNRRGEVAGGGVEFRYGRLKIAPEVRYTRLSNPGANQVSVLAGLLSETRRGASDLPGTRASTGCAGHRNL